VRIFALGAEPPPKIATRVAIRRVFLRLSDIAHTDSDTFHPGIDRGHPTAQPQRTLPKAAPAWGRSGMAVSQPHEVSPMAITRASWRTGKGSSSERGYTWAWHKARNAYIAANPLCVMCLAMKPKRITAANVVDHVIPHEGNQELFWDEDNWQSLCSDHHSSDKQMLERTGRKRSQFDGDGRVVW